MKASAAGIAAAAAFAAWRFLRLHAAMAPAVGPDLANLRGAPIVGDAGWWLWWDQSLYIRDAVAWSHGLTDPSLHWYLPAYPLAGALFAGVMPADPFCLVDLACLLASLLLFARLGTHLADGIRHAGLISAWIFVATTTLPFDALWSWVVPWTTSLSSVGLLASLLAVRRLIDEPLRARHAFQATLSAVTVASCRPVEGTIVLCAAMPLVVAAAIRPCVRRQVVVRLAASALAGAALPAALFGGAYWLVWGFRPSAYLVLSEQLGFEWRLLPLHWVTLMIDPRPLFPAGAGLAARFPWLMTGVAGMVASLLAADRRRRARHVLVAAVVMLECVSFVSYRDLHPPALWRFGVFHYFKWTLPVFGLYSVLLGAAAVRAVRVARARIAFLAGVGAMLALFCWRVQVGPRSALIASARPATIVLPDGLSRRDDVIFAHGRGDWDALWGGASWIKTASSKFQSFYAFKIYPGGDALTVLPLRPMPAERAVLHLAPGTVLTPGPNAAMARLKAVWGLPCSVAPMRAVCRPFFAFAATVAPVSRAVGFAPGGGAEPFLAGGWSVAEPSGRWSDERAANLRFGLPAGGTATFALEARGLVRSDEGRIHVAVYANGRHVADWRLGPVASVQRAPIPAAVVPADGSVLMTFAIGNPRRLTSSGQPDARLLGLEAVSMQVSQP